MWGGGGRVSRRGLKRKEGRVGEAEEGREAGPNCQIFQITKLGRGILDGINKINRIGKGGRQKIQEGGNGVAGTRAFPNSCGGQQVWE
jgi:hypothetical protein